MCLRGHILWTIFFQWPHYPFFCANAYEQMCTFSLFCKFQARTSDYFAGILTFLKLFSGPNSSMKYSVDFIAEGTIKLDIWKDCLMFTYEQYKERREWFICIALLSLQCGFYIGGIHNDVSHGTHSWLALLCCYLMVGSALCSKATATSASLTKHTTSATL